MDQYTIKYEPLHVMDNKNKFLEEYFTGVDTEIFFNGIIVDYISSIQFSLQEQLLPIYGYNSYLYNDVAIGNRIVVGSVNMPLTNYSRLIKDISSPDASISTAESNDNDAPQWVNDSVHKPIGAYEQIVYNLYNSGMAVSMRNINASDITTYASDPGSGPVGVDVGISKDDDTQAQLKAPKYDRADNTFFDTIYNDTELGKEVMDYSTIRKNHITIDINIGNLIKKSIVDVIFRGVDTVYNSDGEPLYETLQFVAKDLHEEYLSDDELSGGSINLPQQDSSSSSGSVNTNTQLPY